MPSGRKICEWWFEKDNAVAYSKILYGMYLEDARKIMRNLRWLVLKSRFETGLDYNCCLTAFFFGVSKSVRLDGSNLLLTKWINFLNSHVNLHIFSCPLLVPFLCMHIYTYARGPIYMLYPGKNVSCPVKLRIPHYRHYLLREIRLPRPDKSCQ